MESQFVDPDKFNPPSPYSIPVYPPRGRPGTRQQRESERVLIVDVYNNRGNLIDQWIVDPKVTIASARVIPEIPRLAFPPLSNDEIAYLKGEPPRWYLEQLIEEYHHAQG